MKPEWFDDPGLLKELHRFNAEFAYIKVAGVRKSGKPSVTGKVLDRKLGYMQRTGAFKLCYGNQWVTIGPKIIGVAVPKLVEAKQVQIAYLWLVWPLRATYDSLEHYKAENP